jgi:hypothetical protein
MMPSLGQKYSIDIEVISKPKDDYQTDEYFELDLPVAPAVMVEKEIVVEGENVSQYKVESCICRHLVQRHTIKVTYGDMMIIIKVDFYMYKLQILSREP